VHEAPSEKKSTANQRKEHYVEKLHLVGYNSIAVFISSAVVASKVCEIARNSPKIRTYSSLRLSKVIDLGANRKSISNFLLPTSYSYS